jgi:FolB domain-containing protein
MGKDQIHIRDLLVRTIIGVNESERRNRQDVLINVDLYTDVSAAASDDIAATINYRTISKSIIHLAEESSFFLVEKLALEIINLCLANPLVERAVVSVEKPGAVRFSRSVGVTVDRNRADLAG